MSQNSIVNNEKKIINANTADTVSIFNSSRNSLRTTNTGSFVRTSSPNRKVMLNVLIALIPATVSALYVFGIDELVPIAAAIASALLSEVVWSAFRNKKSKFDLSSCVTGLMIAHNMPPDVPIYIPIIASAFAIIVIKEMFGGVGSNFINPALAARVFVSMIFASAMNVFKEPGTLFEGIDTIVSATPLQSMKGGSYISNTGLANSFFGRESGVIGETSVLLILIGFMFLMITKTIDWRITVSMIGSIAIMALVFGGFDGILSADYSIVIGHVLGGGAMYGAVFMATDYATSPTLPMQKLVFGAACGALTMVLRIWGSAAEAVSYSILIMSLLVPIIETLMPQRILGERGVKSNA